jgi:hypothetical protein
MFMQTGTIVNAGTLDSFIQTSGVSKFIGANPIYFTSWLQSIGVTTIDTVSIGEYNAVTKSLFDGIFQAKGAGSVINFGGPLNNNIVNMTTIVGPFNQVTPNFWTEVIMDGPTSAINEWNGTAYVPIETSLTVVGGSGIVSLTGNRNWITPKAIDIQKDGTFAQTSGSLVTGGITIEPGGVLTDGIPLQGPGTIVPGTDNATLTVVGDVVNNGLIEALPSGILIKGNVTGIGTMNFGQGGGTIELAGSVAAGQNFILGGGNTLVVDTPSAFHGSISDIGGANTVILKGVTATSAVASNGSLVVSNAGAPVATITTTGTLPSLSVTTAGGNAVVQLGTAGVIAPLGTIASIASIQSSSLGLTGPSFLNTATTVAGSNTISAATTTTRPASGSLSSIFANVAGSPAPATPLAAAGTPQPTTPVGSSTLVDINSGSPLLMPTDRTAIG